ncbi:sialic acid-binding Ig-like lectin 15 [Hoplias malabaricus]|uniref:sialic acid-binding Ig-like lectin 15 n=1 Tax=Hoplias malabaricus TaxID=27720 RepID=UPI003462133F
MKFIGVLFITIYSFVGVDGAIEMDDPKPLTGYIQKSLTVPCTFRVIPDQPIKSATVTWRKDQNYEGVLLYQCIRNSDLSGNCSSTVEHYSFGGNLDEKNISLKINNVTLNDAGLYFCRIELEEKVNWYSSKNITLTVKVASELKRIYFQTNGSGQHRVTCEVFGDPPPKVSFTQPKNMASQIIVESGVFTASYSLIASSNTSYTCQIDGENNPSTLSIDNLESSPCIKSAPSSKSERLIFSSVLGVLMALLGLSIIVIVRLLVIWKRMAAAPNAENVYYNYPAKPDTDGVYMNARKTPKK